MPCRSPFQLHPRNPDGTCHYWKRTDADGTEYAEPQCTYWLKEAYRQTCEETHIQMEQQRQEAMRKQTLTPEQRAAEDGRLF